MRGLIVLALLCSTAHADDADAPGPDQHRKQFGVSVRVSSGLRGIATYDDSLYCGQTQDGTSHGYASVCTGRSPLAFDLETSYGVTTTIELIAALRFGIERDFGPAPNAEGPRAIQLTPGARFFFSEAKRTKLFIQPEVVFDFSGYKNGGGMSLGTDFGVRGMEGLWVDLHRTYGFYVYGAESASVARWFQFVLEAGVGFQGRYP